MKTVITEKQSIAREIALHLGAREKKDGYFTGNGYCVTWTFGHLVSLAKPADYDVLGFQKEDLPFLPKSFKLAIRKIKKDQTDISDPIAVKQLAIIKKIIDECNSNIVATDAGREGEMMFRNIYEYLKCNKPFERLWISSLTEKSLSEGFKRLMQGKDLDGLYQAEKARAKADWLVGVNASEALNVATKGEKCSLGRLDIPILSLICKRYQEYKNFTVEKYFQIELGHRKEFTSFPSLSSEKWDNRRHTEQILKLVEKYPIAEVKDIEVKTESEAAPLLFDLTSLQIEARKKLGFTAAETLEIAQSLYEKKFITYPRTESRYIPEYLWSEIPERVRSLDTVPKYKKAISTLKFGNFNKHIVGSHHIMSHPGILITGRIPSAVSARENSLYEMIVFRLLESLSEPCQKEVNQILLRTSDYEFIVKGIKVLQPGWRSIQNVFDHNEPLQDPPELKAGDELKICHTQVLEKNTESPRPYTETSLLSTMGLVGRKEIENTDKMKIIQQTGIGTPETRASVIENLIEKNYIKRENKALIPTEKGMKIYELVKDKKIADIQMTVEWEFDLQQIKNGTLSAEVFHHKVEAYSTSLTNELLELNIPKEEIPTLICPKCREHKLLVTDQIIKCIGQDCSWTQFRTICGIQLPIEDIIGLITKGRTTLIRNMKSRKDQKFDAFLILKDNFETDFEFPTNRRG